MSETTDKKQDDKAEAKPAAGNTLSLGGKLSLKGGAPSPRPSNAGNVSVEVRRKRVVAPSESQKTAQDDPQLTSGERTARAEALKRALADGGKSPTSLPKRRTTIEDKKKEEAAAKDAKDAAREKELEEMRQIEGEEKQKAEQVQKDAPALPPSSDSAVRKNKFSNDLAPVTSYRDKLKKEQPKPPARTVGDRRGGRITVTQALNRDYDRDRGQSLAAQKRAREKARMAARGQQQPTTKIIREVILPETITVGDLANRMAEPAKDVVKSLMKLGVMAMATDTIDPDTAELLIEEFGHTVRRVTESDVEIGLEGIEDKEEDLQARPPVVTIMGHVDHGKTSLLDALRKTDVVASEAGGITQHIGAYQITVDSGEKVTFLDTPGHAAFTEMRARGASATDIVVIVVSAEDSVMPQTIEAISHAKAAEVPIIIAVNKVDLPDADPMKVKTELLQHEIVVEELSGEIQCIEVSAKTGHNLDKLVEAIILQSEVLELRANPEREAQGVVIESKLERGRGPVATVLIQNGTLKIGDIFVAGAEYGRVRALINDHGQNVAKATLGEPVEILGFNATPNAGDPFSVTNDEAKAREVSEYRQHKRRETQATAAVTGRTTIDDLIAAREAGEKTALPVIIKGDVHGSVEALIGSFTKMEEENPDIKVEVLHSGAGGITESDVKLAHASGGIIIGFNVRANKKARELAAHEGVDIRYYNVIYNAIDDAKAILSGMLSPLEREEHIGQAKIKQVFNITKVGKVAGCDVILGIVKRGAGVRLLRDDVVIHEGKLKTLQRFKDEVKEVKEGMECGMAFESYDDIKEGDIIECFVIVEEARTVQ